MLRRAVLAAAMVIVACGAVYLHRHNPASSRLPHCLFHDLTGFYCPGCGSTRALYSLTHGRPLQAIRCNPLLALFSPLLIWAGWRWASAAIRGDRAPAPLGQLLHGRTIRIILVLICAFWVARNIPFYPFTLLVPPNSL